jgi:hypothetical protein
MLGELKGDRCVTHKEPSVRYVPPQKNTLGSATEVCNYIEKGVRRFGV